MQTETRSCQNCKATFDIEPQDFDFYKKMDVPAPTFCPTCRFQRRLMFRNERVFYKRDCELCGKNTLSVHRPDKDMVVYCTPCWYSDDWDDSAIFMDYDPSKTFFEQLLRLRSKTPHMAMLQDYATLENSDYVNHVGSAKNCYLIFNADFNENVHYSTTVVNVKDSMDCMMVGESELCYEVVDGSGSGIFFSEDCNSNTDVYFSKNLSGCNDCFGCVNLRNKKYHIFNKPYSREEYKEKLKEFDLGKYSNLIAMRKRTKEFWSKHPSIYMHGRINLNVDSTGDYMSECKNVKDCYQVRYIEDGAYCQYITMKPAKDIYDLTEWGNGAQRVVDSISVGEGSDSVRFCNGAWYANTLNVEYSMYALSCQNVFGCSNIRKKSYRILNKQYTKDEYFKLREKVIKDMNENPYVDSVGRVWKYGEFLPYDLSPYDYNESHAIQLWPMTKEEVLKRGWRWTDPKPSEHEVTLSANDIPDDIKDVDDSILKEVIGCLECEKPFKLIPPELALLKKWNFPIPRKCSDCRHMDRMNRLNPPYLWDRKCDKCSKDIRTSYAPERPETVYCKECFSAEVV